MKLFRRLLAFCVIILLIAGAAIFYMTAMPGKSFAGTLPPLTAEETQIKANLTKHVAYIAGEIGERNVIAYEPLQKTAQYVENSLKGQGYKVNSQEYTVQMRKVRNLIVEIPGSTKQMRLLLLVLTMTQWTIVPAQTITPAAWLACWN